jgi:UDP-N-acetylglucosamine--N-acetylmuramyl-(pentapeptide) pyrophosphoryl-undecaprenol N-acetylglucosamine transferase
VAPEQPLLLVTGGSLGAAVLNDAVRQALPELTARFHVVHLCGPGKTVAVQTRGYQQFEFLREPWGDVLAAADIVVSRAGANTLMELLALAKPNLLVPLSRRVSRGDQIENAGFAEAAGYSAVLSEETLNAGTLAAAVNALWDDLPRYRAALAAYAPPDAVAGIVAAVRAAAAER